MYYKGMLNEVAECNPALQVRATHKGGNVVIPMSNLYEYYSELKETQSDGSIVDFIEKEIPNVKTAYRQVGSNGIYRIGFERRNLINALFNENKDELLQMMCFHIDFGKIYHIDDVKNIMGTAYAEFGINKRPTLADMKSLFRLKISTNRQYVKILDYKWSN